MRKIIVITLVAMLLITLFSACAIASFQSGPAPNSGDGVPDGSGMDKQNKNGANNADSMGPAPNSGDGVPDGSGLLNL